MMLTFFCLILFRLTLFLKERTVLACLERPHSSGFDRTNLSSRNRQKSGATETRTRCCFGVPAGQFE